jgi:hypothetical protein
MKCDHLCKKTEAMPLGGISRRRLLDRVELGKFEWALLDLMTYPTII